MQRVLITGGAGFLGFHLSQRFLRDGVSLRLFDRVAPPEWAQGDGIEYLRGDIRDRDTLATALEGVETIVHAAFASPRQPCHMIQSVNVEGTTRLCEVASEQRVPRLILISSTIVEKPRRGHPCSRNAPIARLDQYRAARAAAEEIAAEYGRQGLSVAIVRPKTFLGPGRVSAFAIILEATRRGRPVPVLGSGENRYQLLDVRDMAEAIRLLATSPAEGLFLLGAREFGTVRETLQALLDHAQTGARLRFIPGGVARAALRGMELAGLVPLSEWHSLSAHHQDSIVEITRPVRELGWEPSRSAAQSLIETYDWYVTTMEAAGVARSTHLVPTAHRILAGLYRLFPRSER